MSHPASSYATSVLLAFFLPAQVLRAAAAPPPLDLARLSSQRNESWAPLSGLEGRTRAEWREGVATFTYRGPDGALTYTWTPPSAGPSPLGAFSLSAAMTGGTTSRLEFAKAAALKWDRAVRAVDHRVRPYRDAVECESVYHADHSKEEARLTLRVRLEQKSLVLELGCDQPWLASIQSGNWNASGPSRRIPVPYCGTGIDYLPDSELFVTRFADWANSAASEFVDGRAIYKPRTDATRNPARDRFIFSAAWHLDEVLPNIPNPPSPWRTFMGERVVLDIWDWGAFTNVEHGLRKLGRVGVRDDLLLMHAWQRDGYDNGLPAHWPACEKQGGDAAMRSLAKTARELGHAFALHENYVDYYPNYEHFTTNDLSLDARGQAVKAWFNKGTRIQSFAVKPAAMSRLSREQSPEIHRRYDTTASYLDVHSCVPPWFHVDQRAGAPMAGSLQAVWAAHRNLWAYHRKVHGGPATGEGNGHWFWSGWLDGVEAQFGTGWPTEAGRHAPLLVDFNLLRVHPLQLNHGQGYYGRWHEKNPPWGSGLPMRVLDQYRMQEIAFGHAGFLGDALWDDPSAAWLEQYLVVPVTRQHAGDRVTDIRYFAEGAWVDTTAAAKAGRFDRVRITYSKGLTITANGTEADWSIDGQTLPAFGWMATNQNFFAGTLRRDGLVVDLVETPDIRMANARRIRDWPRFQGPRPIRVTLADFQTLENQTLKFSYHWKSGAPVERDLRVFVHFETTATNHTGWPVVAQQDHRLRESTRAWTNWSVVVDGPYIF